MYDIFQIREAQPVPRPRPPRQQAPRPRPEPAPRRPQPNIEPVPVPRPRQDTQPTAPGPAVHQLEPVGAMDNHQLPEAPLELVQGPLQLAMGPDHTPVQEAAPQVPDPVEQTETEVADPTPVQLEPRKSPQAVDLPAALDAFLQPGTPKRPRAGSPICRFRVKRRRKAPLKFTPSQQ